jgi:hypothetical protein
MSERLELISHLAGSFAGNRLKAISYLIEASDTPLNVRCGHLGARCANTAYLDMMRRTIPQFLRRPLIESFSPDDRATNIADSWLKKSYKLAKIGGGHMALRVWDGKEVIAAQVEVVAISGWLVTSFSRSPGRQGLQPAQSQLKPHCHHKGRKH